MTDKKAKQAKPDDVTAWMPLWIGDYLADTMNLTRDLHGGYLLLLFAYWRNRGPLKDDDSDLAATVKAGEDEWVERIRPKLARFFRVEGGLWHHDRADAEMVGAVEKRIKAVNKARAAAAGRWSNEDASSNASSNAPSTAQAKPEQCPLPSPSPPSSIEEGNPPPTGANAPSPPGGDVEKPKKPSRAKDPLRFEGEVRELMQLYPKRPGNTPGAALKAYTARREEGHTHEQMLDGVLRYAEFCRVHRVEPDKTKMLASFLGPTHHYLSDWTPMPATQARPRNRQEEIEETNRQAGEQFLRNMMEKTR